MTGVCEHDNAFVSRFLHDWEHPEQNIWGGQIGTYTPEMIKGWVNGAVKRRRAEIYHRLGGWTVMNETGQSYVRSYHGKRRHRYSM